MNISREQVEHVAQLARLELTENEKATFTLQMDAILQYVQKLNELDTSSVVATSHAVPMENAFRDDVEAPSFGAENILLNAPHHTEGFFLVPKVIE